jgi:hypothetical protein
MTHPPGTPDPHDPDGARGERDPWATPSEQPAAPPPPASQPGYPPQYGQYPPYGHGPQPGYPSYGPQPGYGYGYPSRVNGKATAALWTGIGSLVLAFCCGLGVIGVLPIVLGTKARSEIRMSGGQQDGDGKALAGIITGAIALVLSLVVIGLIVLAFSTGDANFDGATHTGV